MIDSEADLTVSMASLQEIAYLSVRRRLAMDRPLERWVRDTLVRHEIGPLAPTISVAIRAGSLPPGAFHGDPIDRLIYATAVEHDARLISADKRLRDFDPLRVLW